MLKIENTEVIGWEAAIRGMRNPMNSWEKSDSHYCLGPVCPDDATVNLCKDECLYYKTIDCENKISSPYIVGPNDLNLMTRLRNAGTDHRKFMRMITVYLDITAPLYWWKEFDTYKVGTVANSCSTMHKIAAKEFALEDFSHEHLREDSIENLKRTICLLNEYRNEYNGIIDCGYKKEFWWQMIQLLPSSYNQRRTVMLNYEVLANIYKSRKNHKLDEWKVFCKGIESLPYSKLITGPSAEDIVYNINFPSNDMILGNSTPFDLQPENFKEEN